ncbi:T6SS immunity protein Tli4 family protein [Orbus wheelerorum]|uniref:T6SS immunity protein Tli4 family protein n=1 Tax=Orbus wheelerorum TaxID=3074111 RepID=UPI00370D6EDB
MTKQSIYNKKYYALIAVVLAIILVSGYNYFHKDIRHMTLSKEQQEQVTALLQNSPTRCIGTYLIDLPAVFKADDTMDFNYRNRTVKINTYPQYLPPFKQMIALREQELKNTKPVNPINGNYLKAIYPLYSDDPEKIQGIIFEHMESIGTPDVARILEGYRWQDEVTLKIEIKARNGIASRYDDDREDYPKLYANNVPQKLTDMSKLFGRIKTRDDLAIPTTPGFCFLRGFMQGEDREWKDMNYGYLHNSIENFSFYFKFNDYADDYALLDKPESYFTSNRGHTIYKGTRSSEYLKLEEWIVKGKYFLDEKGFDTDDMGYLFTLGIHMTDPTYKTPQLRLEMYYKIPKDGTQGYSEDQLMVIWHEITNSIKIRESSFEPE